jgi:ankyrin repeat protein
MPSVPRLTQPPAMKTKSYIYGVEKLNGYDAWRMFEASARGDVAKVEALLVKDPRLVNAQFWYRFPIHMALFAGNATIVELLLAHDANPGESIYTYDSWDKLLRGAAERGYRSIESLLIRAMRKRFNYAPEFDALKQAIIARDSRKIAAVLRREPKLVRASDALGNNALHWSVITRQLEWINRFIERGTPIDAQRADGQTPVLLAVNGATDYWYRSTRGRSHASLRDTSVIVGSLLAQGATYTISVAAAVGDQERVEQLLETDSELARRLDSTRVSPLSYASRNGHLHIVRLLLERGADPNQPEDAAPLGRALFEACCANHREVAELLLDHGANPNSGTDSNECCLTIARIYHGDRAEPLEQLLRQHGAVMPPYRLTTRQLKQAIRDGHAVTHHDEFFDTLMARENRELLDLYLGSTRTTKKRMDLGAGVACPRSPAMLRGLLDQGLDPNQSDWLGKTLLHSCAENGDPSVAKLLLERGANLNARELEFQGTPLASAVRSWCGETDPKKAQQKRQTVEFLLSRGAKTNLPDDLPWATPLAWATRYGREDIAKLMKQYGAT